MTEDAATEFDDYGFPLRLTWSSARDTWMERCRALFAERYAKVPEDKRIADGIWEGAWTIEPAGMSVTVVRADPLKDTRGIVIPDNYQERRNRGWILVPSPSLMDSERLRDITNAPSFDHPLDLVGTPVLFLPHQGIPLLPRFAQNYASCPYLKIRIDDVQAFLTSLWDENTDPPNTERIR